MPPLEPCPGCPWCEEINRNVNIFREARRGYSLVRKGFGRGFDRARRIFGRCLGQKCCPEVINRNIRKIHPTEEKGNYLFPEEQLALIFYGTFKSGSEDEVQGKAEEEEQEKAAVGGPRAPTTVGLKARHRTGKKSRREEKLQGDEKTSAEIPDINTISLATSEAPGTATLNLPGVGGATLGAGLVPPSRVRGRRKSFEILPKGGPLTVETKPASPSLGKDSVPSLYGTDSLENSIQTLLDSEGTKESKAGLDKEPGLDISAMSDGELQSMACRMPDPDEVLAEDDPELWFSHSTLWMAPLWRAGKIPKPPACFEELKDFHPDTETKDDEDYDLGEDDSAKDDDDPRWKMAKHWVRTVIRPELQQRNFLKRLSLNKNALNTRNGALPQRRGRRKTALII